MDGVDADLVGAEVRREDEGACRVEGDLVGVCDCLLRVGGGLGELVGDVLVGCAVGGEGEGVGGEGGAAAGEFLVSFVLGL